MELNINKLRAGFDSFLDTKISRLDQKKKMAICAISWVLPIVLFAFLYYSPKSKEITSLKTTKANLEREIQKVEATVRELDKHKANMKETELKFRAASLLLPEQKEIPSLLTNISSQGTNSGLEFLSFKPKGEEPKEFYAEIPVNITVNGPYHNIGLFLDKISKLPRIVSVSNISMTAPKMTDGEMFLKTTFNLITYRFIEQTDGTNQGNKK